MRIASSLHGARQNRSGDVQHVPQPQDDFAHGLQGQDASSVPEEQQLLVNTARRDALARRAGQGRPEKLPHLRVQGRGLHHAARTDAASVVLDVDLDYFCWDDSLLSVPEKRVEITKEAYEDYLADRYHPLRLLPARTVKPRVVGGRYYLAFLEGGPRNPLPSDELILKRIDRLISYLGNQDVLPKAIDVCRSSISGYLPAEKAAFVEENSMKRLGELYPLQMVELPGISV